MIINKKSILTQLLDIDFYWFPINCYWLLLIIDYHWLISPGTIRWSSFITLPWGLQIPALGTFFLSLSLFSLPTTESLGQIPAIGMAQTGLCKFAMNIVDFFLSQINRRLFFEENATAVGNFSTLSAEFWRQYLSCSGMSVAIIG